MKTLPLLFVVLILLSCEKKKDNTTTATTNNTTTPQTNTIVWQKCFGGSQIDVPTAMIKTSDGNFVFVGHTQSTDGNLSGQGVQNADGLLVKIDSMGNILLNKTYGGIGVDRFENISQTSDGGYIVTGITNSQDGDIIPHALSYTGWIMRLDNTGAIIWQKYFESSVFTVTQTADGGFITGYSGCSIAGQTGKVSVIKLDNGGNTQWEKCYSNIGNSGGVRSIIQLTDGGFCIVGATNFGNQSTSSCYGGDQDGFAIRTDINGTVLWEKCFGGTDAITIPSTSDRIDDVIETSDGGMILVGVAGSTDGNVVGNHSSDDFWLIKLDATGSIQWQKCYGGTENEFVGDFKKTQDGGYIIVGYTMSSNGDVSGYSGNADMWVVKTDNLGNLAWQKCLGVSTSDGGYGVAENSSGFIICGTGGGCQLGNSDIWIVKINP